MNNQNKMIFSIISGVLHQMTLNTVSKMGNLSVYYISYLRKYNPQLTLYYGILMGPTLSFCLTLSVGLGAIIEKKVGSQWTIIISAIITFLSTLGIYFFSYTIIYGYFAMIMNGLGCGISFLVTMKNACMYNPSKKGMITAIIMSFGQLGGPILLFVGETIINPHSVIISHGADYFPIEIGANYFKYIFLICAIYPIGTILTLLTFFKYQPISKQDIHNNSFIGSRGEADEKDVQEEINDKYSLQCKTNLKKIFKNKRLYILCTIYFFSAFLFYIVLITFKTIGSLQSFDTNILKYTFAGAGLFLCLMGPVWGYLYDKLKFKKLLIIVNSAGIIIGILLCFSLVNIWFFSMMIVVNSIFFVGMMSIFNPHVMKVYTLNYMMETGGVLSIASGISSFLGAIFAFCVSFMINDKNSAIYAYRIIFILGSAFNVISIIIGRFENDDLFQFDKPGRLIKAEEE